MTNEKNFSMTFDESDTKQINRIAAIRDINCEDVMFNALSLYLTLTLENAEKISYESRGHRRSLRIV